MKKVGIWIDKRQAKIVTLEKNKEHLQIINSNLEEFHAKGGSGTKSKGGPQDVVQDSKYLEREKHQLAGFFKSIIKEINDADSIVIFGPAQTGEKLNTEIKEKHSILNKKMRSLEKAEVMTDNQTTAWVRDYFATK